MNPITFFRHRRLRLVSLIGICTLFVWPGHWASGTDYRLEVVAYSPDYPPDPMGTARAFGSPQMNELGQVHFIASWGLGGQKIVFYLGRPGAVNGLYAYRAPAPSLGGEYLFFSEAHLNSRGELLFRATMDFLVPPPMPLPHRDVIWRDTFAVALQTNPFAVDHTGLPPANVTGAPYTGTGRLQYKSNVLLAPLLLADNGIGYHSGALEAAEGNVRVPVADRCLIQSDNLTRRLVWYDRGPAPGLNGDLVFIADPISGNVGIPLTFGRKNGAFVARTTVRPAGSTNPADNKLVFYQYDDEQLTPFHVAGDPLPGGLPTPMELFGDDNVTEPYALQIYGAQIADENGNTILEVSATSFDQGEARLIGVWKKLPAGLVELFRYDRDYPVNGGIVRFSGAGTYKLGIDKKYAAMGNGKLAFWMHYTGLGQTLAVPALFRERKDEDGGGFERILTDGVTAPGTNYVCTGLDGIRHQALLMNAHREIVFHGGISGGGAPDNAPALWIVDRLGVLRHIVHNGQSITIGGTTKTVSDFFLPNVPPPGSLHTYTPDTARILNDDGAVVLTVRFTDNTRAIIRAVPDGYIEPPLPGRDFWFNNAKGDSNWHTMGGNPPTNWEDLDGTPRSNAPGDVELNTAAVFIPQPFSVLLDQRPAPIGPLQLDGTLTLKEILTLNYSSKLNHLIVQGPNGGLNVKGTTAVAARTEWQGGTMRLEGPVLPGVFRNEGAFLATAGSIDNVGGATAFENYGSFQAQTSGTFSVHVPFKAYEAATPGNPWGIDVGFNSTLELLAGGSFAGRQTTKIADSGVLRLAGEFAITGETTFTGATATSNATLELGTADKDVDFVVADNSIVTFDLPGQSLHFNRGNLRGGHAENHGTFRWKGGRIAISGLFAAFDNSGHFAIESENATRRLEGVFRNLPEAVVQQTGSLELDAVILNSGDWRVSRETTINNAEGAIVAFVGFSNQGNFHVELSAPGKVSINTFFSNEDNPRLNPGRVLVGTVPTSSASRLEFLGEQLNYRSGELLGGRWFVGPRGTLVFPGDIHTIENGALLEILGGSVPSLQLKEVAAGILRFENSIYAAPPGPVEVLRTGRLELENSTVTVNGLFKNSGHVRISPGSMIITTGDFSNEDTGRLDNQGEVSSGGRMTLGGDVSGRGFTAPDGVFFLDNFAVFSSTGTTSVVGAATLAPTAKLEIELSGTAANTFDVLAVTGNASLGGTLIVNLIEGFRPAAGDSFPIVQAGSITGEFANAPTGQRIATIDGYGSVVVNYTATAVVLSAFELNPNPAPTATASLPPPMFGFDGVLEFSLMGTPGREYIVEASANLVDWSIVATDAMRYDGSLELEIAPNADPVRFFRAKPR